MVVWILAQFEAAIYIIAQTVPLLRVLLTGSKDNSRNVSVAEIDPNQKSKRKESVGGAEKTAATLDAYQAVELVQIQSGKIVPANSEEGRALKALSPTTERAIGAVTASAPTGAVPSSEINLGQVDDDVHQLWLSMGLSKRAWSKSPSPERDQRPVGGTTNIDRSL